LKIIYFFYVRKVLAGIQDQRTQKQNFLRIGILVVFRLAANIPVPG